MRNQTGSFGDRIRSFGYVFLAGLVIGIFLGWMLHGLIGFVLRVALFIIAVVLVAAAISFWQSSRRNTRDPYDPTTIDTTWRNSRDRR
jgi:NhaP-type Na+/H+ or K+/H+ antiporter